MSTVEALIQHPGSAHEENTCSHHPGSAGILPALLHMERESLSPEGLRAASGLNARTTPPRRTDMGDELTAPGKLRPRKVLYGR